jgi:hypothetical protein
MPQEVTYEIRVDFLAAREAHDSLVAWLSLLIEVPYDDLDRLRTAVAARQTIKPRLRQRRQMHP